MPTPPAADPLAGDRVAPRRRHEPAPRAVARRRRGAARGAHRPAARRRSRPSRDRVVFDGPPSRAARRADRLGLRVRYSGRRRPTPLLSLVDETRARRRRGRRRPRSSSSPTTATCATRSTPRRPDGRHGLAPRPPRRRGAWPSPPAGVGRSRRPPTARTARRGRRRRSEDADPDATGRRWKPGRGRDRQEAAIRARRRGSPARRRAGRRASDAAVSDHRHAQRDLDDDPRRHVASSSCPDWGSLIELLPLFIFLGVVGPFLTFMLLGSMAYLVRKPRAKVTLRGGRRAVAGSTPAAQPVFPPGLPYCRARCARSTRPGTTRCDTRRRGARGDLPDVRPRPRGRIDTCANCGLVLKVSRGPRGPHDRRAEARRRRGRPERRCRPMALSSSPRSSSRSASMLVALGVRGARRPRGDARQRPAGAPGAVAAPQPAYAGVVTGSFVTSQDAPPRPPARRPRASPSPLSRAAIWLTFAACVALGASMLAARRSSSGAGRGATCSSSASRSRSR